MKPVLFVFLMSLWGASVHAAGWPAQPQDEKHPGSSLYRVDVFRETLSFNGRKVEFFAPQGFQNSASKISLVIYGHGQATPIGSYQDTLVHLARKGVAVVFPQYDSGFFDQDWRRMAVDYVSLANEVVKKYPAALDPAKVIFAGHSKGGYVALVAAGLPEAKRTLSAAAVMVFSPAGYDREYLAQINPKIPVTLTWSDKDTVIKESLVREIYDQLPSVGKQLITVKSYVGIQPELSADHFFPLTKKFSFGGRDGVTPLHYFGSWKWLVAAAWDLDAGGRADNPYVYGTETDTAGDGFRHVILKSGLGRQRMLVRYKSNANVYGLSAPDRQRQLMQQTLNHEKKLFPPPLNISSSSLKKETLWLVNATLVDLSSDEVKQLSTSDLVLSVTPVHRKARLALGRTEQLGLQSSWKYTYGLSRMKVPELNALYPDLNGTGVRVGIIDTGIDANHPDLKNKVVQFKDFIKSNSPKPYDDHGHGTHVAGTIAGGHASGEAIGVAPATQLVVAKAFSSLGNSEDEGLLRSLQWMADPDGNPETNDAPQIISNSWNVDGAVSSNKNPEDEVFCVAIDNLNKLGVAVVFAAGNDGPDVSSILVPGACPQALTVGSTDEEDRVVSTSSRGPVRWNSLIVVKPEIAAPGTNIESADPGGDYRVRSGTSMATPHIAGLLALLYQARPNLSVADAKNFVLAGAEDLGAPGFDNLSGAGRANAVQSVQLLLK